MQKLKDFQLNWIQKNFEAQETYVLAEIAYEFVCKFKGSIGPSKEFIKPVLDAVGDDERRKAVGIITDAEFNRSSLRPRSWKHDVETALEFIFGVFYAFRTPDSVK